MGIKGIKLGGHDHIGEAFKDFQKEILSLTKIGIQLAICSKNEEKVALDAICNHPEMILKLENISSWRINWDDKAQNILEIIKEINIGLDSVVFIDDNPAERDRVKSVLKDLLIPDWSFEPAFYKSALRNLGCFEISTLTQEDKIRTESQKTNIRRKSELKKFESVDSWLEKLETEITLDNVNENNLERVVQLINKTNQFNLSTRRMSKNEFNIWENQKKHNSIAISVKDKFGPLGLVGLISYEHENNKIKIIDFILSCRVMGRKIENIMLEVISKIAFQKDCSMLIEFPYKKTAKNGPILKFLNNKFFENKGNKIYTLKKSIDFESTKQIKLNYELDY